MNLDKSGTELLEEILASHYVIIEKLIAIEKNSSSFTSGFYKAEITELIRRYRERLFEEPLSGR